MKQKVRGKIIHGDKVGTKLGYPTANLRMPKNKKLQKGIYVAQVRLNKKNYQGVAVIGVPSEADGKPKLEIHILDFDRMIYGKWISANIMQKLRDLKGFSSKKELISAIKKDCKKTRKILNMI
ncbi:riboflavin kinase [Patescibacteria group bacterium]|nr:riboflavin kinase [Patescibacteria group bacterium]MBU1074758.1 riboflavin kinase [Patescibacteria group bacterium]MBU1952537.1 riboflavin kinase [Patescibacteria group bacterium]